MSDRCNNCGWTGDEFAHHTCSTPAPIRETGRCVSKSADGYPCSYVMGHSGNHENISNRLVWRNQADEVAPLPAPETGTEPHFGCGHCMWERKRPGLGGMELVKQCDRCRAADVEWYKSHPAPRPVSGEGDFDYLKWWLGEDGPESHLISRGFTPTQCAEARKALRYPVTDNLVELHRAALHRKDEENQRLTLVNDELGRCNRNQRHELQIRDAQLQQAVKALTEIDHLYPPLHAASIARAALARIKESAQ